MGRRARWRWRIARYAGRRGNGASYALWQAMPLDEGQPPGDEKDCVRMGAAPVLDISNSKLALLH
jgi:hypothetical protein